MKPEPLTPLEIAAHTVAGTDPGVAPLASSSDLADPVTELELSLIPALAQPPCVVAFSGGRDSSLILAAAVRVARREGLELPVPATLLFPNSPETEESEWQKLVLDHVGLREWVRLTFTHELEILGPLACRILERHGLMWPANAHPQVPVYELAAGGTALTGLDGDGLFGGWRYARPASALARTVRPEPRDVLRIAHAAAPPSVRRLWLRHRAERDAVVLPWLRPSARHAVAEAWVEEEANEPARWDRRVGWWWRLKHLRVIRQTFEILGEDVGARVAHPLLAPRFLSSLARAGGRRGWPSRTALMESVFGELLPPRVLAREDKAAFATPYWGEQTRSFTDGWDGSGIPLDIVDAERLREAWREPVPDFRSALLVQSAWLHR